MSSTKYIRPMSFFGTLGTMYRLYLKIMFPILILNIILVVMSWWVLLVGAFVGPVLMLASNAILGKPLNVLDSFRRGIFSVSFLKIALVSICYIIFICLLSVLISGANFDPNGPLLIVLVYSYLILSPLWIFIPMIMLLEKKGLGASVKRSFQILRRYSLRIIEMDLFITLFIAAIALLFSSGGDFDVMSLLALFLPLLTGFSSLPYVFVNYEYRARHENYNEELLTQELGYQPIEEMMTV